MADNVEVVKEAYKAFADGNLEEALESWSDDATWQGSDSTELPGGGEHTGKEEIAEVLKSIAGAWEELTLSPDEYFESDDTVVVLLHLDVKGSGGSGKIPTVHVVRLEDGKVVHVQTLTDTLQAAQTLGLIAGNPPSEEDDSDEKDSDEKDSDEKDSDEKDSDEKDSDEKDSDEKDSDEDDSDEKSSDDDDDEESDDS
jgi:ketosteroid isomerase-like protein